MANKPVKREYVVYKITNLVNGKIYIGRCVYNAKKRFSVHKSHAENYEKYFKKDIKESQYLMRSIRKHGIQNFRIETLEKCGDFESMKQRERELIIQYNSINPKIGYNLVIEDRNNGYEYKSPETTEKISKNSQGRKSNSSEFFGVVYSNSDGRHNKKPWMAKFTKLGESYCKRFETQQEACEWYDCMVLFKYGKEAELNYANKKEKYLSLDLEEIYNNAKKDKENRRLGYYGVCSQSENSHIVRYSNCYLGTYKILEEAAEMYDKFAFLIFGEFENLNFPEKVQNYKKCQDEVEKLYEFYTSNNRVKSHNKSGFHNVYHHSQMDVWGYDSKQGNIRLNLFKFKTKEDAALNRDIAILSNFSINEKTKLNFPMASIFKFYQENPDKEIQLN